MLSVLDVTHKNTTLCKRHTHPYTHNFSRCSNPQLYQDSMTRRRYPEKDVAATVMHTQAPSITQQSNLADVW